jgi:cell division initiation protein
MKLTPMDIIEQNFKKSVRGYNKKDVNRFKELAAEALEDAVKQINVSEEKLKVMTEQLSEHEERESVLKETITTAQKMSEGIKENARKEAELIVSEARIQAEDLIKNAYKRIANIQNEIYHLKKQRLELQTALKTVLEYHKNLLIMEEEEGRKGDSEDDKLRFLQK